MAFFCFVAVCLLVSLIVRGFLSALLSVLMSTSLSSHSNAQLLEEADGYGRHAEQETRLSRDSTRISFYTERMGGRENE